MPDEMTDEERLQRIAELDANLERLKSLAPLRRLQWIGQAADKDPESIDWEEAVETLETALEICRREAAR